jgi:hypothetical protein
MAYSYVVFAILFWIIGRFHKRHAESEPQPEHVP